MATQAESLADLVRALVDRRETVATAESITAGGVCAALTATAGASAVVRGGLIVYAADLKVSLAGVPQDVIDRNGTVHPDVAEYLALGARTRCAADWGIGVTGVAGPGPADGIVEGTVHAGLAGPGVLDCTSRVFSGGRDVVRSRAVELALGLLREHLR